MTLPHESVEEIVRLTDERQYISAGELLDRVQATIARARADGGWDARRASQAAARRLDALLAPRGALSALPDRYAACVGAHATLTGNSDGWQLATHRGGVRVQWRREYHGGSGGMGRLSFKIDGPLEDVRPADAVLVWREAALYSHWFPLVTSSRALHESHATEVQLHTAVENALVHADLPMHGFVCDHLKGGGFMLIVAQPLDPASLPAGVRMPPYPSARRVFPPQRVRAELSALVEPLGPSRLHMAFSISYPLHDNVPGWAINHLLTHGMANIYANMAREARRLADADPTSAHVRQEQTSQGAINAAWIRPRLDAHIAGLKGGGRAAATAERSPWESSFGWLPCWTS